MSDCQTRYRCWQCDSERWLPERPLSPTASVKIGCESCGAVRTWRPVGSPHPRQLTDTKPDDRG